MEAGGGGGDRAGCLGIDRLVTLAIGTVARVVSLVALDVGRERHSTDAIENGGGGLLGVQLDVVFAGVAAGDYGGGEIWIVDKAENARVAAQVLEEHGPASGGGLGKKESFDQPTGRFLKHKAGGEDAGVVED